MRQVNQAELVWNLKFALSQLAATYRNGLASRQADVRRRAEAMVAQKLAERLHRYEILTDAPLPPNSDLFTAAAYNLGSGAAPMIGKE